MKQVTLLLVIFHSIILVFWVANSSLLFSTWGTGVWLALTITGFVLLRVIKEVSIMSKLLLVSSWLMVFLLLVTIAIEFITTSMP
ncbi:hypothetical protein J2Y03_004667 [Neobacillus niacini]|uniref:hypothetical protein n=1 Tax=Neobacillus niacini TaxID=86668 RepID=UPI002863EA59|nr:hypothetical protein [Neobacillus niacini]MDR7079609.1 hypothetical protein [Neobacillus niacini]